MLAIDEPPDSLQDCRVEIAGELHAQTRTLMLTVRRRDHDPQLLQALTDLFPGAALILIDRVPITDEGFPAETVLVGKSVTAAAARDLERIVGRVRAWARKVAH